MKRRDILEELANAGFIKPTPIQSKGWHMAMSGQDVISIAKTGSGKTLDFRLPAIVHINAQPLLKSGDGPIVLILAATRELAIQIKGEADKFGYTSSIKKRAYMGVLQNADEESTIASTSWSTSFAVVCNLAARWRCSMVVQGVSLRPKLGSM